MAYTMTKDEALKQAIWMLETIQEGKKLYETRWIADTIYVCEQALNDKCNGWCGEHECNENQKEGICKRIKT